MGADPMSVISFKRLWGTAFFLLSFDFLWGAFRLNDLMPNWMSLPWKMGIEQDIGIFTFVAFVWFFRERRKE
jgi:hypothetical protein